MPSLPRSARLFGICSAVAFVLWLGRPAPGKPFHNLGLIPPEEHLPISECHGYYPTCWRRWPEHCHNCPPVEIEVPEETLIEEVEPRLDEELPSELFPEIEDFPDLEMPSPVEDPLPELRVDPNDPSLPPDKDMPLELPASETPPEVEIPDPTSEEPPLQQPEDMDPAGGEEDPLRDEDSFNDLPEPGIVPPPVDEPLARQPTSRVRNPYFGAARHSFRDTPLRQRADAPRRIDPFVDRSATSPFPRELSTPNDRVAHGRAAAAPVVQRARKRTQARRHDAPVRQPYQPQRLPIEDRNGASLRQASASQQRMHFQQDPRQRRTPMGQQFQPRPLAQRQLSPARFEYETVSARPVPSVPRMFQSIRPAAPIPLPVMTHADTRRTLANHRVSGGRSISRASEPSRIRPASVAMPTHLRQPPSAYYSTTPTREPGIRPARR